jgi:hypothetical protein
MSEIKRKGEERLSPRQAAERLTDIAYALTTGGTLNLGGGQRVTFPIADEVVLKREGKSNGGHIKLELSWSTTAESPRASPEAAPGERAQSP